MVWLRSVGAVTGELPFLRGTVRATQSFGGPGQQLVTIAWDSHDDSGLVRVLGANLTLVSRIAIDAALNT